VIIKSLAESARRAAGWGVNNAEKNPVSTKCTYRECGIPKTGFRLANLDRVNYGAKK